MMADMVPPHAEQTEKAMMACILSNKYAVECMRTRLLPGMFYSTQFQAVWGWIAENGWTDPAILSDKFPAASDAMQEAWQDCQHMVWGDPSPYLEIMRDYYQRREMLKIASKMTDMAHSEYEKTGQTIVAEMGAALTKLLEDKRNRRIKHIAEIIPDVYAELEACTKQQRLGVMSGLADIDGCAGGYQPGDFVVIAARPGMGKSSFATNVIRYNAIEKKIACLVFTLEMDERLATARALFAQAGQSYDVALRGLLTKENYVKLGEVTIPLSEAPIYFDDTAAITLADVASKTERLRETTDIKIVIVDHMQLMGMPKGRSRNEEVSEITAGLKSLARDQKIVVIGLSQLSRECERRNPPKPMLSDLRDSGSIEQDADKVMFLYREEKYQPKTDRKGICDVIVAKNRNGRCGEIETRFNGLAMRFEDIAHENEWR